MSNWTSPTGSFARKRHVCEYCSESIEVGESQKSWTFFDGGPVRLYVHEECADWLWEFCADNDDQCPGSGAGLVRGVPSGMEDDLPCVTCGLTKLVHSYRLSNTPVDCEFVLLPLPERMAWVAAQEALAMSRGAA